MAAKKVTKKTRKSQYDEICNGIDYRVISFKFESIGISHAFHFNIINEGLTPIIYDGPEDVVRLVLNKVEDIAKYQEIAEHYNGIYKACNKNNDFE